MIARIVKLSVFILLIAPAGGLCHASGEATASPGAALPELTEGIPEKLYQILGPVGADKKTIPEAKEQLRLEAKKLEADAVIGVRCEPPGIQRDGLTWSKQRAYCRGIAVRFMPPSGRDGL